MATIDDKRLIDDLIANHGHYTNDPPVLAILEYRTSPIYGSKTVWAVMYGQDPIDRYAESFDVRDPKVLFLHRPHEGCVVEGWLAICLGPGRWEDENGSVLGRTL